MPIEKRRGVRRAPVAWLDCWRYAKCGGKYLWRGFAKGLGDWRYDKREAARIFDGIQLRIQKVGNMPSTKRRGFFVKRSTKRT